MDFNCHHPIVGLVLFALILFEKSQKKQTFGTLILCGSTKYQSGNTQRSSGSALVILDGISLTDNSQLITQLQVTVNHNLQSNQLGQTKTATPALSPVCPSTLSLHNTVQSGICHLIYLMYYQIFSGYYHTNIWCYHIISGYQKSVFL